MSYEKDEVFSTHKSLNLKPAKQTQATEKKVIMISLANFIIHQIPCFNAN